MHEHHEIMSKKERARPSLRSKVLGNIMKIAPAGTQRPVLNKKADNYPRMSTEFGRGILEDRKRGKRRHVGHQADTSDIGPRAARRTHSHEPVSSQEEKHMMEGKSTSRNYAKKMLLKLKDRFPTMRRGNAREDPIEYVRGRHGVETWNDYESSQTLREDTLPGKSKFFPDFTRLVRRKPEQARRVTEDLQRPQRELDRKGNRWSKYYK